MLEDKTFDKEVIRHLPDTQFEYCTFKECKFEETDFFESSFLECEFVGCTFNELKTSKWAIKNCQFVDCKIPNTRFDYCSSFLLEMNFQKCDLSGASFFELSIKGMSFQECNLKKVDFESADLENATFNNCDLEGALFEQTNLKGSDFSTSFNYIINPEQNNIKQARFSIHGLAGLLTQYNLKITNE